MMAGIKTSINSGRRKCMKYKGLLRLNRNVQCSEFQHVSCCLHKRSATINCDNSVLSSSTLHAAKKARDRTQQRSRRTRTKSTVVCRASYARTRPCCRQSRIKIPHERPPHEANSWSLPARTLPHTQRERYRAAVLLLPCAAVEPHKRLSAANRTRQKQGARRAGKIVTTPDPPA